MIRDFIKQYRILLITLVLVLVGLHMFSSSIDDPKNTGFFGRLVLTIYEPIYKLINYPFSKASGAFSNFTSIATLREENEKLLKQNKELQTELNRLSELAHAASRYAKLMELKNNTPGLVTYARVIARPPSGEYRVLVLDKGDRDGVKVNMTAVTSKGLVGHIVQTGPYACKVLLITDANSSIPAVVQRTRANAIVKGQSTDRLKLKFLQRSDDVDVKDIVVTSGLGGIFPKGIVIGKVAQVTKEDFGVYQDADITTDIELERVEEVAILEAPDVGAKDLLPPVE